MRFRFALVLIVELSIAAVNVCAENSSGNQGVAVLSQPGENETHLTVQVEPPPVELSQPTIVMVNNSCCSAECSPGNEINCPNGAGNCCPPQGGPDPCAGAQGQNVCACYSECGLTCAVGGRTCPDICYFGAAAPVPVCESICQVIISSMMALCQAAIEAEAHSFTYNGVAVSCSGGGKITGCEPIHIPCHPLACVDCLFCSAIGLCGVKVSCSDDDVTPTPTPTATASPTVTPDGTPPATVTPIVTVTPSPTVDGVYLRN